MMRSQFSAQVVEHDASKDTLAGKGETLKLAAVDWAGSLKEAARAKAVQTGFKAETYVRNHPGRFIAGACCVGLAAGWLVGRGRRGKNGP
jgi:ElaB/YqjD/DUF883 family membrane-anchored ribosome-binding protein